MTSIVRASMRHLVVCSNSPWAPPMRREQAFAREAACHGHPVDFVEHPIDVRAIAQVGLGRWVRLLNGESASRPMEHVDVWRRATPVPGHRGSLAGVAERAMLARLLGRRLTTEDAVIVAYEPWVWRSVTRVPARRRVFDCGDNWAALLPRHGRRIREQCYRIAAEADTIIVTSGVLGELFPGREVTVVRNGTEARLCDGAPRPKPNRHRLVYAGTLSERFDAPLMGRVLDRLPEWVLVLHGPCCYSGQRDAPDPELAELLSRSDGRAAWLGTLPRSALGDALDAGDVLVLPNRPSTSAGQDSMKLYDYCARGRPIVSTIADQASSASEPPHVYSVTDEESFAAAVCQAEGEPAGWARERVRWASEQTYAHRWPVWEAAVFGPEVT